MSQFTYTVANVLADNLLIQDAESFDTIDEAVDRAFELVKSQTLIHDEGEEPTLPKYWDEAAVRQELYDDYCYLDPDGAWCVNIFTTS